ncbi:hypothetical protein CDV31_002332 [Fusarium ambrosium]|uniref:Uncharacterized protein n=1 Tax=Fusarium ambrosium TaxID=131363 RepID=A0A428UX06_9HYPO|nr:hypothetical protein CDV31_002332 [Fusarium ambrosium]
MDHRPRSLGLGQYQYVAAGREDSRAKRSSVQGRASPQRRAGQDTAYIACRTTTNNLALATPHSFTRSSNNNSNNGSRIIKPLQHGPWSLRHNRCPQASPSPQASVKSLLAWIVG